MNPTIAKIVSLLFEDLAETEETNAIREEILQNCQDRYQDLREAGISEDDAIHAVIESLSGMEEMLKEYPRKADEPVKVPEPPVPPEIEDAEEREEMRGWSVDPAQSPVHEIRMENMGSADVFVKVSEDEQVHVECSSDKVTLITGMDACVLTIMLSAQKEAEIKEEISFSLQDGFDLSSLGRMLEKLTRKISSSISGSVEITLSVPASLCPALKIGTASGSVTVETSQLERLTIGTASGDVEVDSVSIQSELRVTTASGDVTVTGAEAEQMQLSSTSGDIEASGCLIKSDVRLNTTSGDISWCKQCRTLNATSISGDITLEGSAESISFRTVSGDVEITPGENPSLTISGNTTSGDVNVCLPKGTQASVSCNTVSGDIYNHAGSVPGAPVTVKISTVSGDIEVN